MVDCSHGGNTGSSPVGSHQGCAIASNLAVAADPLAPFGAWVGQWQRQIGLEPNQLVQIAQAQSLRSGAVGTLYATSWIVFGTV
jgi:hypothetical protein